MTEETFLKAKQLREQIKSYEHHILSLPVYENYDEFTTLIPKEMFERQQEEKRIYLEMELIRLKAEFAAL